uniref:Uncharacterized protein n=1 Tax=Arundo donax TaxID=35708 RepID=A0A0A9EG65_ARUDO
MLIAILSLACYAQIQHPGNIFSLFRNGLIMLSNTLRLCNFPTIYLTFLCV